MKKIAILLSVLFCVVFFALPAFAEDTTGETTEETTVETVSVSQALELPAETEVYVEGLFVGVSFTNSASVDYEVLIMDTTDSSKLISVRNVPYGTFPDVGYVKGDLIGLYATVKKLTDTHNPNKQYLEFSTTKNNCEDIDSTVISRDNEVTFDLSSPVVLEDWADMKAAFKVDTLQPYTLFKFTGTSYMNHYNNTEYYRPNNNPSANSLTTIKPDATRTLAFRDSIMEANVDVGCLELFDITKVITYPGKVVNKEYYFYYVGADSLRFYCVILDESWVIDTTPEEPEVVTPYPTYELTENMKIVKEIAYAYRRQGRQIEYDQSHSRRHISPSPEDATAQHMIYLDCSSYVNAVYLEAFGVGIRSTSLSSSTSTMDTYALERVGTDEVVGYWLPASDTYETAESRKAVYEELKQNLRVGDILNYRHGVDEGTKGHVYIYVGDGVFLHRPGSGSYVVNTSDPSKSYDSSGNEGIIQPITLEDLFSESNSRYLFKKTASDTIYSFSVLRPLARGLTPTEESRDRMTIAGLAMEKVSDLYENSSVVAGSTITYTVTLKNEGEAALSGVTLTDTLPTGTTFVSGSDGVTVENGTLTWTGDVAKSATVTVTYTVEVPASTKEGTLIVSDKTDVNGVGLGKITHTVSTYSSENSTALTAKITDYTTGAIGFGSNVEMARALYNEALNINLFDTYASVGEMLDDLIDDDTELKNYTRRTDTALSKMIAPNLFGGMNIRYGHYLIPDNDRARLISKEELAVGDIILADWSGGDVLFVYAGGTTLLTLESGKATALTIGTDIYGTDADNILVSLYGYDRVAVLRPSMTTTVDADKKEQATLSIICDTTLPCGAKLTLTTSGGSGDGDIIYTITSGTGEALLDGNRLYGVKEGTVTVTAIKLADSEYNSASAEITITISPLQPISVASRDGKLTGLDFEKFEYEFTPVTLKNGKSTSSYVPSGNDSYVENPPSVSTDKWAALTSANNTDLAGLYKVRVKNIPESSIFVYVYGPVSYRQSVARYAKGIDNGTGNDWHVGVWSTIGYNQAKTYDEGNTRFTVDATEGSIRSKSDSHRALLYDSKYENIVFISTSSMNPALYITYTEEDAKDTDGDGTSDGFVDADGDNKDDTNGHSVTRALYAEAVKEYSTKYALKANEILPASDFNSFTYGVDRVGSINIGSTGTKLCVLVYDIATGEILFFEGVDDVPTSKDGTETKHTVTSDELSYNGTTLSDYVKTATGYILGYEIFPVADFGDDVVDEKDVTIVNTSTNNQFYVTIYYGEYDIDTQVLDVPKFTFDPATKVVSGLEANTTDAYYILQLELDKTGTVMQVVENSKQNLATNAKGKADLSALTGLWGIGANSNNHGTESTYKMIYLSGPSGNKRYIGDINESGVPAKSGGSTWTGNSHWTDWAKGVWKGSNYIHEGNGLTSYGYYYRISNSSGPIPSLAASGTASLYDELYEGSDEVKLAAQQTVAAQVNAFSYKYAYMDEEIIPAKDFTNFTYRVGKRQGTARLAASGSSDNTNTKLVVYVAESDNTVTKYEHTINEPTMYIQGTNFSNQAVTTNKPIVFKAEDLVNGTKSLDESDGYIVGIEIFPVQITDPTEITAYKNSSGNFLNYFFGVDIRYTDSEYKIATHTFDAPTATMVEGDTLLVADYNEDYKYEYKAGDGEWTAFEGSYASVDKAGTDYDVRVAATDYYGASAASSAGKSHAFVATGTSLLLSGDIGIKTTFDVSDTTAFEALKFFDTATGDEVEVVKDANSVTIYVPAKDNAQSFEYGYTYEGTPVTRSIYSVAAYIDAITKDETASEAAKALALALDGYTTQADIYFDENKDIVVYEATNSLTEATVDNPVANFSEEFKKAYRGTALILEGKTAIRHYFDATSAEQYTVTIGGDTATVHYDDLVKYYYVDVENVSATDYGVQYEVSIGGNTVKYSVLNYLKNKDGNDSKIGNLARAMYDYYEAAKAYAESLTQPAE